MFSMIPLQFLLTLCSSLLVCLTLRFVHLTPRFRRHSRRSQSCESWSVSTHGRVRTGPVQRNSQSICLGAQENREISDAFPTTLPWVVTQYLSLVASINCHHSALQFFRSGIGRQLGLGLASPPTVSRATITTPTDYETDSAKANRSRGIPEDPTATRTKSNSPGRRRTETALRYKCRWNGCEKTYGTLNRLNARGQAGCTSKGQYLLGCMVH